MSKTFSQLIAEGRKRQVEEHPLTVGNCNEKLNCLQLPIRFPYFSAPDAMKVKGLTIGQQYDSTVKDGFVNMSAEVAKKLNVKPGDIIKISDIVKTKERLVDDIWKTNF
jgi:hypothetical protein